ncbi:PREDICTED: uncharacterized protein LOC104610211 [Nelumbo nucifera]|uniref:Uncharacterized protein LOC104610211 n=2 Tax=Nelumbo nucifera TaxID=4432 RepID=A0A1U8B6B3_NELNU|nr:PREDICTED: uncharacterized protein LOC104610211 [Nelumbo nucifera]DAD38955.1 TPA_asm: hypothetical protein HUJ06_013277 [Nelumbo nucifera]
MKNKLMDSAPSTQQSCCMEVQRLECSPVTVSCNASNKVTISAEDKRQKKDSSRITEGMTAYEMLEKFNFPKGMLPRGVKGYVLHEDNRFEVFLDGDCKFEVEGGYSLYYKRRITGRVGFGSLKDLEGVSVKYFFIWFGITEVNRGDVNLDFYVGPMSASFPLSNFE